MIDMYMCRFDNDVNCPGTQTCGDTCPHYKNEPHCTYRDEWLGKDGLVHYQEGYGPLSIESLENIFHYVIGGKAVDGKYHELEKENRILKNRIQCFEETLSNRNPSIGITTDELLFENSRMRETIKDLEHVIDMLRGDEV